jgi:hypothetical protein
MRVIYITPRLENAERIAGMLEAEGVKVRLISGPHHRRAPWKGANYRQASDAGNWPRIMVLNNGDLPRGRAILRDAGVLPPAAFERRDAGSDDSLVFSRMPRTSRDPTAGARVVRIGLLVIVLIVGTVQLVRHLA